MTPCPAQDHSGRDRKEPRGSAPDPRDCQGPADIGNVHHDVEQDIWFECVFDKRMNLYTWTILPPAD